MPAEWIFNNRASVRPTLLARQRKHVCIKVSRYESLIIRSTFRQHRWLLAFRKSKQKQVFLVSDLYNLRRDNLDYFGVHHRFREQFTLSSRKRVWTLFLALLGDTNWCVARRYGNQTNDLLKVVFAMLFDQVHLHSYKIERIGFKESRSVDCNED